MTQLHKNNQQFNANTQPSESPAYEIPSALTQRLEKQLDNYDLSSFSDRLRFFHHQLTNASHSLDELWKSYLLAGVKMFMMVEGGLYKTVGNGRPRFLSTTDGMEYLCCKVDSTEAVLQNIAEELENNSICSGVFPSDQVRISPDLGADAPAALRYFATAVEVREKPFGILLFVTSDVMNDSQGDFDCETLKLMAEGVASMIELRNVQPAGGSVDLEYFATDGVSGLREYTEKARLPELFGVPNRVVEILIERIGKQQLGIDYIADSLNLSKRTLQRRLQQQDLCFADIRDQVRFHFAIEYLIRSTDSIDSVSSFLDFSDRTSFTNAFKRWTGLSPSTFRKLFRDYA